MAVNDEDFTNVMAGLEQAAAFMQGARDGFRVHVPNAVDVKSIRSRTGLTQAAFATRYGFSKAAVTDWEQGRRRPEAAARALLTIIDREPEAVERALTAA